MKVQTITHEVNKAIVGKEKQVDIIMMCLLAKGHVLLEDIPGVGKTTLAKAFANTLGLEYKRIQFTPDVLASDIVGFNAIDQKTGEFVLYKGAAFTNLFLADEINRTSSRTQSALLEVMEENQITVDGQCFEAYEPFNVLATQNPYGSAGTQKLPESQMDRFMICISLGYPSVDSEIEMIKRKQNKEKYKTMNVCSKSNFLLMQQEVENIFVHDEIIKYVVELVNKTRNHEMISLGASPRASICLIEMSKASAYLNNRDYVIPQDIHDIFYYVMNHRITLKNINREEENKIKIQVLNEILNSIKKPNYR